MAEQNRKPDGDLVEEGAYELIRQRLRQQGGTLHAAAAKLNEEREALFGGTQMSLVGSARIRTENNCIARDIANVAGNLLFGYNVYIGLRSETGVDDVLRLHRFALDGDDFELEPVAAEGTFLDDGQFKRDFHELYEYYREARLTNLRRVGDKLLAVFRTGRSATDTRVFRWRISNDGAVEYIDARGERDNVFPPSHAFEWQPTGREQHVSGRNPHVVIEDELFVNTVGGDLTVKIENNTDDGLGIYREPVEDENQTLADAQFEYARVGVLLLLKIRPYREERWRYLVYNTRTQSVDRIDAIGAACAELPEDHGIIFPGGYYLASGEHRTFDANIEDLEFQRVRRSPNGEDVLYVFHHLEEGRMMLLSYNLIAKALENPIHCHGYSLFEDGRLVVFRFDGEEPTRVHPMQMWQTAYYDDVHAAARGGGDGLLAKLGNAELVRAISDSYSIHRMIEEAEPSVAVYEDLIAAARRMVDAYHWLDRPEVGDLLSKVRPIQASGELVLGEFEKVQTLRSQAAEAEAEAEARQRELLSSVRPQDWQQLPDFVGALTGLRQQRGHLITLRETRYVDLDRLAEMEAEAITAFDDLGGATVRFLLEADALAGYVEALGEHERAIGEATRAVELTPIGEALDQLGEGLDLLNEVLATLKVEDATQRTAIIESISEVYAHLNRVRATLELERQSIGAGEARAEFAAQFALLAQSVTSALGHCDSPERTDEQLNRLLVQLEDLEGRFGDHHEFVEQLTVKREEIYEAFESRKQTLLEERQRRALSLGDAAERILDGVLRRSARLADTDELNAYFATDPMVPKLRDFADELRALGDSVRADDLESRIKASREQAGRTLRDRQDMFEDGGQVIRLGRHRFSVVEQSLELTLLPRNDGLAFHLTGTDFFAPVDDAALESYRDCWDQEIVSETAEVCRAEYLAASLLDDAEQGRDGLTLGRLREAALEPEALLGAVRERAAARYDEGYERGVHDADAAAILARVLELRAQAGLLRYGPGPRALACLFWALDGNTARKGRWAVVARSLGELGRTLGPGRTHGRLVDELEAALREFAASLGLEAQARPALAAAYLATELEASAPRFATSAAAEALVHRFQARLEPGGHRAELEHDLTRLGDEHGRRLALARSWLERYVEAEVDEPEQDQARELVLEAAAIMLTGTHIDREPSAAATVAEVTNLLARHPRIRERTLTLRLDDFLERLHAHAADRVPRFRALRELKHRLAESEREQLRLEEFKPRPLSTFVRNRLIDEVYLPLIGDNLAKQMGALGEDKRTDQMGILLLISPPGYGKTTLMEYVASRLGLIFMKINCPSVGHEATSVDPAAAPDATSRQEIEKLNLALEMGNNVMLYLDDIQHTNPEFLQKFISMGDAQRKMEGVWRGQPRTYDLRGKRVCVVMAGNPYTESGEAFSIPDMLANRADIYNLGDILGGREDAFSMSYIENCLTSNPTLAPLATRQLEDLYKLVRMAAGEEIPDTELAHPYSATERHEIVEVLKRLGRVREVVLRVNQQYIASAAQADVYRTEPPFKLQGSYRNMNKLAEKVVAVMSADELERLIDDHYQGEAQTLTTGAEENLLKLGELRGTLDDASRERWEAIGKTYRRVQAEGGGEAEPVDRVVGQLSEIRDGLTALGDRVHGAVGAREAQRESDAEQLGAFLNRLHESLERVQLNVQVVNKPVPGMQHLLEQLADAYDQTLLPLLSSMHHKLSLDDSIWRTAKATHELLQNLDTRLLTHPSVTQKKARPLKRKKAAPAKPADSDG